MHHLWLQFLHVLGVDNAAGRWYLFWSGFVGDITILAAILVAPYVQWKRNNCQTVHCWRFGRHPFEHEGVVRHLCWKHHPSVERKQLTSGHLRKIQERHGIYIGKRPGRG